MDCGIPFCNNGCPLGNLIPDWNDLVYRDRWREAIDRLHATNNFPEFTGRLCPAPCEAACVLGINQDPVTIKQVEVAIIDRALGRGLGPPGPSEPADRQVGRGRRLGSGRPGRGAAARPAPGTGVIVFERADRIGGLLRYGIPEFKMEKRVLDRRLAQMRAEGTEFRVGVDVGVDVTAEELREEFDAVVLAGGATAGPRPADPGPRARRHPPGDGVPAAGEPGPGGRLRRRRRGDHRQGPQGRHHRRRRHRCRLPRAPRTARVPSRPPVRDHAAAARGAPRGEPVADLAVHLPHLVGPRGGRRAGLLGQHRRVPRRRRRAGARRSRTSRSSSRWSTVDRPSSRSRAPRSSSRSTWSSWRWASPGPRQRPARRSSVSSSTRVATSPATATGRPT